MKFSLSILIITVLSLSTISCSKNDKKNPPPPSSGGSGSGGGGNTGGGSGGGNSSSSSTAELNETLKAVQQTSMQAEAPIVEVQARFDFLTEYQNSEAFQNLSDSNQQNVEQLAKSYEQQITLTADLENHEKPQQQIVARLNTVDPDALKQRIDSNQNLEVGERTIKKSEVDYCYQKYTHSQAGSTLKNNTLCYYVLGLATTQESTLFAELSELHKDQLVLAGNVNIDDQELNNCEARHANQMPTADSKCYYVMGYGTKDQFQEYQARLANLSAQRKAEGERKLIEMRERYRQTYMQ